MADFVKEFGVGTPSLIFVPPSGESYLAAAEYVSEQEHVEWKISLADTVQEGTGRAQLSWIVGNTVAKTKIYDVNISESIGQPTSEPPTPEQGYFDMVAGIQAKAEKAAKEAQKSETNAKTSEVNAQKSESATNGDSLRAQSAAANALESSKKAARSAQFVAQSADAVQTDKNIVTQLTEQVKSNAGHAKASAQSASDSATKAAKSAEGVDIFATVAEQSATQASESAKSAKADAVQAHSDSESAVQASKIAAEESEKAIVAEGYVRENIQTSVNAATTAVSAKSNAEAAATRAQQAAISADSSEAQALIYKNGADSSASNAKGSEKAAKQFADAAATATAHSPMIGENGNWFVWSATESKYIDTGVKGAGNGKSAYEIALENGFTGTEQEWLESLKGEQGVSGIEDGEQEPTNPEVKAWLKPVENPKVAASVEYVDNNFQKKENNYELIDTINFEISAPFDKSATPDGVTYAFSAITVTFDFSARENDISTNAIYVKDEGNNTTQIGFMSSKNKSRMFAEANARIRNGYVESQYFAPTAGQYAYGNANFPGYYYHFRSKAVGKISRVFSGGNIPQGSIVKIYAIK